MLYNVIYHPILPHMYLGRTMYIYIPVWLRKHKNFIHTGIFIHNVFKI